VSSDKGRQIKEAEDHNEELRKIFQGKMGTCKCVGKAGSKMENNTFVGFASIGI
jgi:hypothetical protein